MDMRALYEWLAFGDTNALAQFASSKGARANIIRNHLTTNSSTTDGNSFTTASVSPGAGRLMLVWIVQTATTANGPSSFTGTFAGTLTQVATFGVAATRISLYRYLKTSSPDSGTITINFSAGDATTGCAWSIVEYGNVNTSGSNGAGAIVQNVAAAGGSGTTTTITLAAFEHANNVHAYGLTHGANEATTPGTGFIERGDTSYATPATALETADAVNDTTADPSWATSVVPRYIAVEVKAG